MKRVFTLVEELISCCSSNKLKVCVSSVLALNKHEPWKLLSCSEESDACRADFVCRDEAKGSVSHLSYELNKTGQFGYIAVEAIVPTAVKA